MLLRKRQTEADAKITSVNTDYYYDTTVGAGSVGGYGKRPPANGPDTNGSSLSPATEPLIGADRRLQHQMANTNGTNDHHVITVRCWPNDRGGGDVTMTSCSTFKMAPDPKTNCVTATQLYSKDGGYVGQQTVNGRSAL